MPMVPLLVPAVLIETRMFSIEAAVRAQFEKALVKLMQGVESNIPDGKLVRELQPYQALVILVTDAVLSSGKLVRELQSSQVAFISVTNAVFSSGKLVRELQPRQALSNVVAAVVFKLGNVPVSCVQPLNALAKLVTVEVSQVVGISYKYLIAGAYTELL